MNNGSFNFHDSFQLVVVVHLTVALFPLRLKSPWKPKFSRRDVFLRFSFFRSFCILATLHTQFSILIAIFETSDQSILLLYHQHGVTTSILGVVLRRNYNFVSKTMWGLPNFLSRVLETQLQSCPEDPVPENVHLALPVIRAFKWIIFFESRIGWPLVATNTLEHSGQSSGFPS